MDKKKNQHRNIGSKNSFRINKQNPFFFSRYRKSLSIANYFGKLLVEVVSSHGNSSISYDRSHLSSSAFLGPLKSGHSLSSSPSSIVAVYLYFHYKYNLLDIDYGILTNILTIFHHKGFP